MRRLNVSDSDISVFFEKMIDELGKEYVEKFIWQIITGKKTFKGSEGHTWGRIALIFEKQKLSEKVQELEAKLSKISQDAWKERYNNLYDSYLKLDKALTDTKLDTRYYLNKCLEYEKQLSVYGLDLLKLDRSDFIEIDDELELDDGFGDEE